LFLDNLPFIALKDARKGPVVWGPAQGQHVVGLLHVPPDPRALQPYMTDGLVGRLNAPAPDGIASLAGPGVAQPLLTVPQEADQLPDLLRGLRISWQQGLQPLNSPVHIAPEQALSWLPPTPIPLPRHHQTVCSPSCVPAHGSDSSPGSARRRESGR
jgi:hypothetical protein